MMTAATRLRADIDDRKYNAERRNNNYQAGFGFMLRHWNTPSFDGHTEGRRYWIICREGWPRHKDMQPKKRETVVQQRRWALDDSVPF